MASVKVISLLIKTLSKPLANRIKTSAQEHPKFRKMCVSLAQSVHRHETRLSSGIFSKVKPIVRPLSETKAIQNGANFLSEAFVFSVALSLIVGENLRGRIKTASRRDAINDRLNDIEINLDSLKEDNRIVKERLTDLISAHESQVQRRQSILREHEAGTEEVDRSLLSSLSDGELNLDRKLNTIADKYSSQT
ncbi:optic atrophy 3 protein-domain-containing protein, partial [Phakopsora pachyrhizi]